MLSKNLKIDAYKAKDFELNFDKTIFIPSKIYDKEIEMEYNIVAIEPFGFTICDNVESVIIPNTVEEIGSNAFSGCERLKNVRFVEGIRIVNDFAFKSTNLKTITFPGTIEFLGDFAFSFCEQLETVNFLPSTNNKELEIGESCFKGCFNLKSVKLPKNLEVLKKETFSHCHSLKSLIIPNEVSTIETNAIFDCAELEYLQMPLGLRRIDTKAINNCPELKEIVWGTDRYSKEEWNKRLGSFSKDNYSWV